VIIELSFITPAIAFPHNIVIINKTLKRNREVTKIQRTKTKEKKRRRNQERQKISQRSLVHPHQSSTPPNQLERASLLVSPLVTPSKPFVSPSFHFNYLVLVASVHEQFTHAY